MNYVNPNQGTRPVHAGVWRPEKTTEHEGTKEA